MNFGALFIRRIARSSPPRLCGRNYTQGEPALTGTPKQTTSGAHPLSQTEEGLRYRTICTTKIGDMTTLLAPGTGDTIRTATWGPPKQA